MRVDQKWSQLAERQLGLITRRQLVVCGLTLKQIRYRIEAGELVPAHSGVFSSRGAMRTPDHAALAACLACGAGAVASFRTAGHLWGIHEQAPSEPHVTVPGERRPRPTGIKVHRSLALGKGHSTRRGFVPITTMGRTLIDLAGVLRKPLLESASDEAFRRGLSPKALLLLLDNPVFRSSSGREFLESTARDRLRGGVPESELETRMLRLIQDYGLPAPVRQARRSVDRRAVRFDFVYPDHGLVIELDGRAPHWGREAWQSDHDRDNAIEMSGLRKLAFTWWDVTERPSYVAMVIGSKLGLRPCRWTST